MMTYLQQPYWASGRYRFEVYDRHRRLPSLPRAAAGEAQEGFV